MSTAPDAPLASGDDLSSLSWVHDELRKSLEVALKALRRWLKEAQTAAASELDAVDPAILRQARAQFHQSAGVLELVGLGTAANVLRAAEAALLRLAGRPRLLTAAAVETIERGAFALLDYLSRLLAGRAASPLAMFPQYRALQDLAAAARIHPADLWAYDWSWQPLLVDARLGARQPDVSAIAEVEAELLALMRGRGETASAAAGRMSDLFAALGAGASGRRATLWLLAAAFFEAEAAGWVRLDVYSKRVASRLLAQLRASGDEGEPSDRLAKDLLFFCAQSRPPAGSAPGPRLAEVRRAWRLDAQEVIDYEREQLGRFDPALIAQARKRVAAAKSLWADVGGGDLARLAGLAEQFALVGDSVQRLYPDGGLLARSLQAAAAQTAAGGAAPPPALAMEVATALLYVDASLDAGDFDAPELSERIARLALRVGQVRKGRDPGPIELWMEELYRRVSDRQTMGSVVQELRAALAEIEKSIDQYFRDPARRELLIPVPAQLSAMRGVLSVLGLEQASQAVLRMRDDVDALASTEVDPLRAVRTGAFDHLADNLGALSFLIDMVSVQPQMAKSLFRFDAATGKLSTLMPRRARPTAYGEFETGPADVAELTAPVQRLERVSLPQLDDVPSTLAGGFDDLAAAPAWDQARGAVPPGVAGGPVELDALRPPAQAAQPASPPPPSAEPAPTGLEEDAEMRAVFLEEAREVIASAARALGELVPGEIDLGAMTTVRRGFHTLKGSSRMVGLAGFGDAAWACEQLYNALLAGQRGADEPTRALTADALAYFGRWVDAIEAGDEAAFEPQAVVRAADAMRLEGLRLPIGASIEPLLSRIPDLPSATDLEFAPAEPAPAETAHAEAGPAAPSEAVVGEPVLEDVQEAPPLPEIEEIEVGQARFDEESAAAGTTMPAPLEAPEDAEQFKRIGPLRIGIALFNIYLNEADELSRRLGVELAEWALERHRPIAESTVALAHSLAGSSATVGYTDLSALARALEHALERTRRRTGASEDEARLFVTAADEVRRLLHQFAAGFLADADAALVRRLDEFAHGEPLPVAPLAAAAAWEPAAPAEQAAPAGQARTPEPVESIPPAPAAPSLAELGRPALMPFEQRPRIGADQRVTHAEAVDEAGDLDAVDAIDAELFPIFEEEAQELLHQLHAQLRNWSDHPEDGGLGAGCMRTLHTLKGGARLAGAMRLGELAHRLETAIEHQVASPLTGHAEIGTLVAQADALEAVFDEMRRRLAAPSAVESATATVEVAAPVPAPAAPVIATAPAPPPPRAPLAVDWQRFQPAAAAAATPRAALAGPPASTVRVRASLLDRLVNQAGEISITRARLAAELGKLDDAMRDLAENTERLRAQLREIELQGELQIGSRLEAARALAQEFDPLELDRYTRFQELTRMMAESVADVATLQRGLQRALQAADDDLAQQTRLTRDMQDDLLRTRMVEFEGLSERLYRVVRQAAKESGRQVRLDIVGGQIEIDRGVLERMTGTFEHLLRNAVVHGIEPPDARQAAGKDPTGLITVTLTQAGNEVGVEVRDDGAGLNLARIRARALEQGLVAADAQPSEAEIAALIFEPGFSTAGEVTGLAGRGVGMDVVRTEAAAIGGRIETASALGQGTGFRLVLPLTTAVTRVVMLRCGDRAIAVPSTLVEIVRRVPATELAQAYASGAWRHGEQELPFFWLDALLQGSALGAADGRSAPVVVIRSADQRVALHVDEVLGNQEVIVKHLGPQLSRLPGLVGMTLLPSGAPALIYNPVALATLYGEAARERTVQALRTTAAPRPGQAAVRSPLILVVDDSLTVRRVTQRLLEREGWRVALAKDGLEGLERLAAERPAAVLTDIEMPRMDGFDLVRNLRADPALADLPVIMITSRIAPKHREYAAELGVDHYLGKPYAEDELVSLLNRYTRRARTLA